MWRATISRVHIRCNFQVARNVAPCTGPRLERGRSFTVGCVRANNLDNRQMHWCYKRTTAATVLQGDSSGFRNLKSDVSTPEQQLIDLTSFRSLHCVVDIDNFAVLISKHKNRVFNKIQFCMQNECIGVVIWSHPIPNFIISQIKVCPDKVAITFDE